MKFVMALVGLAFALASAYVGYMFVTVAMTDKMIAKGFVLQSLPLLGGIALVLFALPLIWNSIQLVVARVR